MCPWSKIRALEARNAALNANLAAAHADAVAQSATVATLKGELAAERERFDRLLQAHNDLRREGFNPPLPWPEHGADADALLPPVVEQAVRRFAGTNDALAADLRKAAMHWLEEHGEGEEAAEQCAAWITLGRDPAEFGV